MKYMLAIDQGTSSTRAMLYTTTGQLIATRQYAINQLYPEPGWVEHCPEEIWSKTIKAVQEVVSEVDASKILGCGITNQRETTLIWDKRTGRCLSNAIVWQDRRTEAFCESLSEYKTLVNKKTGLFPNAYFSASKLNWLLTHIPEAKKLAKENKLAFGTIDSFLIGRLTQGKSHVTDITNASRTLLYNIFTQQWDEELLSLFKIPHTVLPEVQACDGNFGVIDSAHFGVSIPILAVAGDQQAALIGQRCFTRGMVKATFGTGGFLLMNTGEEPILSRHNLLTTVAYKIQNKLAYGLEGSLYHAGTTIKWLRDEMKIISSAADTERLAASLSTNDGVYLVPSFTGMGAPHWWSTSGAIVVGLSQKSTPAHFARAALESVCYQTREVLSCMIEDSQIPVLRLKVDGGMAINNWLLQFLASQCATQVQRPRDIETTAQGVAMLAALSCGELSSFEELQATEDCERSFQPEKDEQRREKDFNGWLRALRMLKGV